MPFHTQLLLSRRFPVNHVAIPVSRLPGEPNKTMNLRKRSNRLLAQLDEWEGNQVVKSCSVVEQDDLSRRVVTWALNRVHSCSIGMRRKRARKPASVSGRILSLPMISSLKLRGSRFTEISACTKSRTCR